MINNRQAGRRRGRNNNNPRQNGGGGNNRGNGGDSGNRIDNRARGNAAQLLEKYRNMARDAQLVGDRVNMEYYLQFADHYFRVLADNRARQEENQQGGQQGQQRFRRFDENDQDDEFGGGNDDDGFGDVSDIGRHNDDYRRDDSRSDSGRSEQGRGDQNRNDQNRGNQLRSEQAPRDENRRDEGRRDDSRREEPRANREPRRPIRERAPERQPVRQDADAVQQGAAQRENVVEHDGHAPAFSAPANDEGREEQRPRATRGRKPRREVDAGEAQEPVGLDAAVLPPAIGKVAAADDDAESAPPRRVRRPRATPTQAAE